MGIIYITDIDTVCSDWRINVALINHLLPAGFLLGRFSTLNLEVGRSVHIQTTRWYIPEDGNIHCYRYEDFKSSKTLYSRKNIQKQSNSVALSPQANSADWATATYQRNLVPTFADRGVSRGQRGGFLAVVNLCSLDRSRYFSFK
jgi:hypothetical protein